MCIIIEINASIFEARSCSSEYRRNQLLSERMTPLCSETERCYHAVGKTERCYHAVGKTERCYHAVVKTERCFDNPSPSAHIICHKIGMELPD